MSVAERIVGSKEAEVHLMAEPSLEVLVFIAIKVQAPQATVINGGVLQVRFSGPAELVQQLVGQLIPPATT